ncbi:ATP-binding protein [Effusibacillus lacus]|uniref:Transposase n=1 Tax=Effusibacillus lacus TaxID=1348429 RepID=A0A292YBS2_9BACL|nr:ATP-binding protein [Effusibacillus lacus]TCS68540.1 AAA domain-containing protein [Effusibacillus lacus]GAX88422.1 transposase [Effusibacillus lacus]
MSENTFPKFHIAEGLTVEAKYLDPLLDDYRNNPLIEALPPIWDEATVANQMASRPVYKTEECSLPPHLRLHCVQRITRDYFQPLSHHLDLEQRISRLLRDGYVGRNPLTPNYAFRARKDAYQLITSGSIEGYPVNNPTSSGFAFVGISGIGKSSAVLRVLSMYPQVVVHSQYRGKNLSLYQIVWVKMDCPHDGSIRGLCLNFFLAVDSLVGSQYYKRYASGRKTVDELLPIMAQVAAVHCIGVLVIDEIQNLIEAKVGSASKMLNFFVQLVNTIGLPVIVVGTFKALPILNGEFRNARRGTGQGDLIWDRLKKDEEWEFLLQGLWKYQWTTNRVSLSEEFIQTMYEESQGITDIAIKLFMLAQWRAIDRGIETISPALLRSVARDQLQLLQPALNALRSGDTRKIEQFGDVYSSLKIDDFLNELSARHKRQERIEILKQELGFDVRNQTANEIVNWLTGAGIHEPVAKEAANRFVEEHFDSLDEVDVHQEALKFAIHLQQKNEPTDVGKKSEKKRTKITPVEADDVRSIVQQGRTKKLTAYASLKAANYIKDPMEFIS